ncbi:MAG: helix-turn-helix domain-containing protein [Leptolyngbyaceae cyanobacterium CSU_1_4]|nr:helix-turn-helix domain-containing protein [Leptolyngbyaceae cyanobacterium CSU_1_4]
MKHAVKVRIYPTHEQQISLSKAFGCARWFWNNLLALTHQLYKAREDGKCYVEVDRFFPLQRLAQSVSIELVACR